MRKFVAPLAAATLLVGTFFPLFTTAQTAASITLPYLYTFNSKGEIYQSSTEANSTSPYWWVSSGGQLSISGGVGKTVPGSQSIFRAFARKSLTGSTVRVYIDRLRDNLSNTANRHPYNGEFLISRYVDSNTYYYAGLRADGYAVIAKKVNGSFRTLASKKVFAGTWSSTGTFDLIPLGVVIGLKLDTVDTSSGPSLSFSMNQNGSWQQLLSVVDNTTTFGTAITASGLVGVQSDFADVQIDNFSIDNPPTSATSAPVASQPIVGAYDTAVLADSPIMYLTMANAGSGSEPDKSGKGHSGSYKGGTPSAATMPNGDAAADFNGSSQYLTVPDSNDLSVATTRTLTWEAWIRPDVLQFPASGDYVDFLGKCDQYSPTCEWEGRMYNKTNSENRPNRISGYVFNPSAGLGSAADWQPGVDLMAGQWLHVVVEYQTASTPSGCNAAYPGTISIWVNGVPWSMKDHMPTGCMSQFSVTPKNGSSALNIGTMAFDTWFKGAIGKVAVYNRLLTQTEINEHFAAMTGAQPSGSCAVTCTTPVPTQ